MYGDSWLDTAYAPVVEAFRESGQPALMTVFRNEGRWDTSNVWFENGRIRLYDKRERLPQMQHIDWGLGVIRSEALAARPIGRTIRSRGGLFRFVAPRKAGGIRGDDALLRDRLGGGSEGNRCAAAARGTAATIKLIRVKTLGLPRKAQSL